MATCPLLPQVRCLASQPDVHAARPDARTGSTEGNLPQGGAQQQTTPTSSVSSSTAPELDEFRQAVRNFARSVIAPHAEEIDRSNSFPKVRASARLLLLA